MNEDGLRCWVCFGSPSIDARTAAIAAGRPIDQIVLCDGHYEPLREAAEAFEAKHPGGVCPPDRSCGCKTLGELKAELGIEYRMRRQP